MSDKDDAKCDKALLFLQERANATREVTAAMVTESIARVQIGCAR